MDGKTRKPDWFCGPVRTLWMAILMGLVLGFGLLGLPQRAAANFNNFKGAECISCHVNDTTAITTASNLNFTFKLAVNGVDIPVTIPAGTSTFDSPTVSVTQNTVAQIDFYQRNVRGTGDTTLGYMVITPAAITDQVNWLLSQGAVGTAPAGWNATVFNAFQNDTGEVSGWANTYFNDGAKPTPQIYYNAWIQEYSSGGAGTKAEGDEGGTDFGIAIPATASGPYVLELHAIGHDDAGGRHSMVLNINLNVTSGGADSTPPVANNDVAVTPEFGSYVPASFTVTGTFTDAESAVSSCEYTLDGSSWSAGTVSGTGPYTCTANVSGQVDGTALSVNLRATSAGGGPTASTAISRTVDAAAPVDGATFTATAASSSQVDLAWSAASDSGSGLDAALPYKVVRAPGATAPVDCTTGTVVYNGSALNASDTGLAASTQYAYRVCAYDALGQVSVGNTATATTQAPPATPPDTAFSAPAGGAVLSGTSASLAGTATAGTNPLASVQVSTDNGGTWIAATGTTSWSSTWALPAEDYVAHTLLAKAVDNTALEDPTPASVTVTVDTLAPTGLANSSPANGATGVATGSALTATAASDGNPTIEYQFELATDAAFTAGLQTSTWQTATSWSPTLSGGTTYYWRVSVRDGTGNTAGPTATWNFQTAAGCTRLDPAVVILTASRDVTTDGGFADYAVQVTNNDSAACGNTLFSLSTGDSNSTNFYPSVLAATTLDVAPGGTAQTTFRVLAKPNQANGVSNDSTVTTAADANHGAVLSAAVTTTINVAGGGCAADGSYPNTGGDQFITSR